MSMICSTCMASSARGQSPPQPVHLFLCISLVFFSAKLWPQMEQLKGGPVRRSACILEDNAGARPRTGLRSRSSLSFIARSASDRSRAAECACFMPARSAPGCRRSSALAEERLSSELQQPKSGALRGGGARCAVRSAEPTSTHCVGGPGQRGCARWRGSKSRSSSLLLSSHATHTIGRLTQAPAAQTRPAADPVAAVASMASGAVDASYCLSAIARHTSSSFSLVSSAQPPRTSSQSKPVGQKNKIRTPQTQLAMPSVEVSAHAKA